MNRPGAGLFGRVQKTAIDFEDLQLPIGVLGNYGGREVKEDKEQESM